MGEEKIFAIYKPKGFSSNQVLEILRQKTGCKKIGHAGTLDPLASGVLVIGVSREGTKKLAEVVNKEKEYLALIRLGAISQTDDAQGPIRELKIKNDQIPSFQKIIQVLKKFRGKTKQKPPLYSAIKIRGREAYKRVRQGERIFLKSRLVEIKKIKVIEYNWPFLKIKVITGPGVYLRSLARDLGEKLRVGGYLAELERQRVGNFTLADAFSLEEAEKKIKSLLEIKDRHS